jgi:membrane protease YdiL (CAAX protease family)
LVLGLAAVFALFHLVANRLGSERGQAGMAIATIVVAAVAVTDWVLFRPSLDTVIGHLGLGRPQRQGVLLGCAAAALLLLAGTIIGSASGMTLRLLPRWSWMLPGLFAQAGIAEEVLFRGFLFRCVRIGRSFWRAAVLSMVPFVGVHLLLFWTMPWPVALAALLLSVIISFPLAHLFELGGNTIWAPALLHFVVQGAIKVVNLAEGAESFAIGWMIASAVVPLLIFVRYPARS